MVALLVHALLEGHHAFPPRDRVCELCWDLLPADAQSVSTMPSPGHNALVHQC